MFIKNNESFICTHCGKEVDKHPSSSRNHCPYCLWSQHVDIAPGDRNNDCQGMMKPIGIEIKNGETNILFECTSCKAVRRNIIAPDDNEHVIIQLSQKPIKNVQYEKIGK
jgi:hypothetical protein